MSYHDDAALREKAEALKEFDWTAAGEPDTLTPVELDWWKAADPQTVIQLLDRAEAAEQAVERVRALSSQWRDSGFEMEADQLIAALDGAGQA